MRCATAGCLLVALLASGAAQAAPDRGEAKRLKDLGTDAMNRRDYTLALDYFQAAYRAYPSAKLLFNVALALDLSGRVVESLETYERFLAETGADTPPEALPYARRRVAEL